MWETLHLFSRYTKGIRGKTTSGNKATVSGYSTVNCSNDSMTVILVNRDLSASRTATVNLTGFSVTHGRYQILELSSLPSSKTFISHTSSALKSESIAVSGNLFTITLPALSTTAVILTGTGTGIEENQVNSSDIKTLSAYPNPTAGKFIIHFGNQVSGRLILMFTDLAGNTALTIESENNSVIDLSETGLAPGLYFIRAEYHGHTWRNKLVYTKR